MENFEEKRTLLSNLISVLQLIFENFDFKLSMENREGTSKIKIIWTSDFFFFERYGNSRENAVFTAVKGLKQISP